MDLSGVSLFCRKQAECAALFESIVQIKPGVFSLKSPFKENSKGSLHCYVYPNAAFSPTETISNALVRHAQWYLKIRDEDALRARVGTEEIKPCALRLPMSWIKGIVRPTGEVTRDPAAGGKPAILVWRHIPGDPSSFAIELCGPDLPIRRENAAKHGRLPSY